jgi:hypothetical protein
LALPVETSLPDPPAPAANAADCRDLRLDACRGVALWFIYLDHVPDNLLSWLTLRNYGFSDTTEVFVFVSGYTCMIAYGGALQRQGWGATVTGALRRGWDIYVAFLLLLLSYLALVQLLGGGDHGTLDDTNTAVFFDAPAAAVVRALALQYMPVNTDVLPTFVVLHLSFPALLWLLRRAPLMTLAASLALYIGVQLFSWDLPTWPHGSWFFNPLAWQVLFVFGGWYAWDGAALLQGMLRSKTALLLAALYLAFSFAVAMSWHLHALEAFMPVTLSKLIYPVDKSNLAPVRLLHFLALAVVVARLVRNDLPWLRSPLTTAAIRCGENSLAMYCFGVLLAFAAEIALKRVSPAIPMQVAVSLAGIALMIAAATVMTWTAKLDQHRTRLF